jgi:hypothetical protein
VRRYAIAVIHDEKLQRRVTLISLGYQQKVMVSSGAEVTMSASFSDAIFMKEDIFKCLYLY